MPKIPLNVVLSHRLHVPVFTLGGSTYPLWSPRFWRGRSDFDIIGEFPSEKVSGHISKWQESGSRATVEAVHRPTGYNVKMHFYYFFGMLSEWQFKGLYEKGYLPSFSLKGKTVLDVGAGEGETALFYLSKGAKEVICVEPWGPAVEMLKRNVEVNRWPVEIIPRKFELTYLQRPIDFAKFDCELCEAGLLSLDSLGPAAIESHTPEITAALCKKFGMHEVYSSGSGLSLVLKG